MSIKLGTSPEKLTVVLAKDADFFSTLRNSSGDWESGVRLELRLGGVTWLADISGPDAVFSVDSAQVNQVLAAKTRLSKLYYINGEVEICWGVGMVEVSG